jgi:putative lipoprotein
VAAPLALALGLCQSSARAADPDPWWGPDKAFHFGFSAALASGGYGLGALASEDYGPRIALGSSIALAAGASKELLDLAGLGDPSFRDLAWDVVGTAVGIGITLSIDLAVRGAHPGAAR